MATSIENVFGRRITVFVVELIYLGALLAAAALYIEQTFTLPGSLGTVPMPVPWFGALGAVLISLTGVFEHEKSWDPGYALWHYARPLIGASLGIVSVLIFQAGVASVGSNLNTGSPGKSTNLLYYLVAFLVGYREETFRELIKRLVDVVLAPGAAPRPTQTILALSPNSGPRAGGTQVGITGAGLTKASSVKFGSTDAGQLTVVSDNHLTAVAPPAAAPGPVTVTVQTDQGPVTGPQFTYLGP